MDPECQGALSVGPLLAHFDKAKAAFPRVGNSGDSQPCQSSLTAQTGVSPEHKKVLPFCLQLPQQEASWGQERGQRLAFSPPYPSHLLPAGLFHSHLYSWPQFHLMASPLPVNSHPGAQNLIDSID